MTRYQLEIVSDTISDQKEYYLGTIFYKKGETERPGFPNPASAVKGQSISFWLTTSLILAVTLVSVISIGTNYLDVKHKSQINLMKSLDRNITALADILKVPLWTYDQETIEDIGNLYAGNEDIVTLTIIDSLGKTLFHISKKDNEKQVLRTSQVVFGEKVAGSVQIALSSRKYRESIRQLLWSGIITMVINLSVLILITGFLLRLFLAKPLSMLSEIVNSYASGDYESSRAQLPYIEFQPAVAVIRSMGSKITGQIEELKQAEKKFRGIFENAVEGIFQIAPNGSFINANPSLAKILGYDSPADLMAMVSNVSVQCFEHPDDFKQIIKGLANSSTVTGYEIRGLKKNKATFWVSVSARAVTDDNQETLFIEGSIMDISDRKEKEEAEKRQKAADAANQAKTMFIARMSHELRTPLNSVLGMTEMLMETNLSQDQVEYIKLLQSSGEFLESIINDILDFSKIEAQQLVLDAISFDLSKTIEDVAALVSVRARGKNLTITTSIDPDINPILIGDPVRLKQILINLAGNSVKFTKEGHVSIQVEKIKNGVIQESYEEILFRVSDSGIGIPESKLETIFESFTQADSFVKRQFGGTGLGLSICKHLVELMGGSLSVQSVEGQGSSFTFTLILKLSPEEPVSNQHMECHLDPKLTSLKILLVDDIEPNRTVIHKFLNKSPVTIVDAKNGKEAVDLFSKDRFDLILMDVEMPVMSGLEATHLIRERENATKAPPTPLIILSAHAFGEQRKQCYEAGCNDLLVKPIRKNDLINAISSIFDKMAGLPEPDLKHKNETDHSSAPPKPIESRKVVIDAMFEDLLDGFFIYFNESLESMEKAAREKNFEDLYRLGHGLKGSSRNYEFYKLGDIFFEIEKAAADKNVDDAFYFMGQAREYLDHVEVEFVDKG
ncbi:MAG: response regulator [Proteobacteria bacterium]|nr:response regulator [Pseudomonadota bacterium]